jgi:hypothetical protein
MSTRFGKEEMVQIEVLRYPFLAFLSVVLVEEAIISAQHISDIILLSTHYSCLKKGDFHFLKLIIDDKYANIRIFHSAFVYEHKTRDERGFLLIDGG